MVGLSADVIRRYERFSLYNSPYPAHDAGCAIDLYPAEDEAVSPVSGEVLGTRTVRCPKQPYAAAEDSLILIDCGAHIARLLHVDPTVEPGDVVETGESLGTLIRSGFFGRWVDNHIHLGFRTPGQNLQRASGSLPIEPGVTVRGLRWDGVGTIREIGATYVLLDSPATDEPGFTALASDDGIPLDGGLPHYRRGGVLSATSGEVSLLGTAIGEAKERDIEWRDIAVYANDRRATGLSLFASQRATGSKLVFHEGHDFEIGEQVRVSIEPTDAPIQLG